MSKLTSILAILATAASVPLFAQHNHSEHSSSTNQDTESAEVRIGDPWPLDTCIVSGGTLGSMGDPIIRLHEGREVRFCCAGCVPKFEADPATYLQKADLKITEQQKAFYPLEYCIIDTKETLSQEESENATSVVGNRLFIYCCPPCDETVREDPAKYIAILDQAAIEKQKADYPLTTCVISGQPLDSMGGAVDRVIAGQLVRLCCTGCDKMLTASPTSALDKVAQARSKAPTSGAQ